MKSDRNNVELQLVLKHMKKTVKASIKIAKSEYYLSELNKNKGNISGTWKTIRDIIPDKDPSNLYKFDNMQDKAEEFNNFFCQCR